MTTASSDTRAERDRVGESHAVGGRVTRWISNSWLFLVFFAGCILFWQFSIDIFEIPRYILPKPTTIVEKGWADIDRLIYYTYITGSETVIGYAIAVVAAVPLGLAIAFSSFLRKTLYPLCVSIEMVPKIAFAPLFVSWLGFGLLPKVIIVILVWVRLPAAMPQCFVGFKYAAINATVGATIAEFIGSDQGLGFYIQIATGNMRPDLAFAGIFFLTALGLVIFGCVSLAERLLIPWHISVRRSAK
jgi:NitT/TauT family transport system permease protein